MRYQWSDKVKDEIIVVEGTDEKWEAFIMAVEKARVDFGITSTKVSIKEETTVAKEEVLKVCGICGKRMILKEGMGKRGPWKGWFCTDIDAKHPVQWVRD